jgi:hypothetical protein
MGILASLTFLPASIALWRWCIACGQARPREQTEQTWLTDDEDESTRGQFLSANSRADNWFARHPQLLAMKKVVVQPFRRELWFVSSLLFRSCLILLCLGIGRGCWRASDFSRCFAIHSLRKTPCWHAFCKHSWHRSSSACRQDAFSAMRCVSSFTKFFQLKMDPYKEAFVNRLAIICDAALTLVRQIAVVTVGPRL